MLWLPVGIEEKYGIKFVVGKYEAVVWQDHFSEGWGWCVKGDGYKLIEGQCKVEGMAKKLAQEIAVVLCNETDLEVKRVLRRSKSG